MSQLKSLGGALPFEETRLIENPVAKESHLIR
jgi:hypothetical protein